jgi:alpha-mannosidase
MLEMSKRMSRQIPGCPNVKQSFAREFFEKLEENLDGKQIPKWCGDLYLEFHRGTYTSMGRNKKNNRKMEFELEAAEFFQTIAKVKDKTFFYEKEKLDQGWKLLMLNQFHDILPGSSIKEVYEDSDIDYQKIKVIAYDLQHHAMERIEHVENSNDTAKKEKAIYVWNTLSFSRSELILLPKGIKHVKHCGNMLDIQCSEVGNYCFVENIPPKGYTVLYCIEEEKQLLQEQQIPDDKQSDISDVKSFETRFYKVAFNDAGEITELYDKAADRDVIKKTTPSNRLVVYEDRPSEYDAWNIDNYYTEKSYPVDEVVEWMVEPGELFTKVHCKKKFMDSYITQDIIFYEDMEQIDFKTVVDWKQEQLLLKADFDIDVLAHQATCEIQYGNVVRNTHKNTSWEQAQFEVCAHKWVDVSEEGYGAALMNDCKYGYSFNESNVSITLIKSGIFPNPDADKEVHQFTYSILPHEGDFREGHVIQQAYQLNVPCILSDVFEVSGYQDDFTLFGNVEENVIIETLKKAEETDDLIIRLYEAYGKRGNVSLNLNKLGVKNAWICNLLEEKEKQLHLENSTIEFPIKPYEIVTIRIQNV